jgi:hypothetical protein
MYICGGETIWANIFICCEYLFIILLAYLYTSNLFHIFRYKETNNYENLDLILIILSLIQIYLMILELITDSYLGLNMLQGIFKFSQNSIITGCLLFQIMLWQHYSITLYIIKYFIISMIVFDLVTILFVILFETSFFEINYCRSVILIALVAISIAMDFGIFAYAFYKRVRENENEDTNNPMTLLNEEDDQYNIGKVIQKYATSIKKMKNYYLIIIATFTISFLTDIYMKVYWTTSEAIETATTDMGAINNAMNSTLLFTTDNNNNYNNTTCSYYGNLGENFSFDDFIFCNFALILRDLTPHVYIFVSMFRFKQNLITRSSNLIEAL